MVILKDRNWLDCSITSKVKISSDSVNNEIAIITRYTDDNNYYYVGLGCFNHQYSIAKTVNGVPTEIVGSGDWNSISKNTEYNLFVSMNQNTITLFVNNVQVLSIYDASLTTEGKIGLRAHYGNVQVLNINISSSENPSPTPTPTPTPTPKVQPTPTPTPNPTISPSTSNQSSRTNAIWLEHPTEEFLNNNPKAIVQKMQEANIKIVFLQIGNWRQSGSTVSINYWWSSQTMQNTINTIRTLSNNQIEVHAHVIWSGPGIDGYQLVNLADSNIRARTVTAAVDCVQRYDFDGFNDNLYEGFSGSDSNYVSYANALGNALTAINKKSSCDIYAMYATNVPLLYGGITQMTYVCPMFYDTQPWYEQWIKDQVKTVLVNSKCQVLLGLMSTPGRGITLPEQISWVGNPSNSNLAGITTWALACMETSDWTALCNWANLR